VQTQDLILAAVFVLGLAGMLSLAVWRLNPLREELPPEEPVEREKSGRLVVPKAILGSRHLTLTVVLISLAVVAGSLVDFQFMTISWQTFGEQAELTSFLGRFYGRVSLISLLVQLVLTTRLLKKLGAGGVLLLLPGVLLLGAGFMLAVPGLLAGMVLNGSHLSLKYSLDKTSRELLFLPVPMALKRRTKLFMDTMVDRLARGLAGGLLLLCSALWGANLTHVGVILLVVVILWLVAAYFMRHAYIDSFRQAVARRHFGIADLTIRVNDSSSLKTLVQVLEEGKKREVIFALRLLEGQNEPKLMPAIRPHVNSPFPEVRRLAVAFLARNGSPEDIPLVLERLEDPELMVRVEAIGFMGRHWRDLEGSENCLGSMLFDSPASRNAVLAFFGREDVGEEGWVLRELIDTSLVNTVLEDESTWGTEGRTVLARLSWLPVGCEEDLWDRLLDDPDPKVVCAACAGIGLRGDLSRADRLLERLARPGLRSSARAALIELARREPELLNVLEVLMHDPTQPLHLRLEVPRILKRVVGQESVDILMRHLASHIPEMRYQVLKALNRLRVRGSQLVFDARQVGVEINLEAGRYLQLNMIRNRLDGQCKASGLLCQALDETQKIRLESVFRLMGLLYRAADVVGAQARLNSGHRVQQANAREFLANILNPDHRELLDALLDGKGLSGVGRRLGVHEATLPSSPQEALEYLSHSCDPWLAACARHAGATHHNPAADPYLEKKGDEMLTPVEKVLLMQEVDVLRDLPTDLLAALATQARESHRQKGDVLFRQDDHPDAMYIIVEGAVSNLRNGQPFVTNLAGEEVGLWALFHDEPRPVSAVVENDALLLRIDQDDFQELLSGDIRVAKSLLRTMAGYLFHFVSQHGWPGRLDELDLGIWGPDNPPGLVSGKPVGE
jgi:HEAT repeat protein